MNRVQEAKTVACMIQIYCRGRHRGGSQLCPDCQELLDYAMLRLSHCPHGDEKPFCSGCSIHCYHPHRQAQIRQVMRYAGPRMLLHHPVVALRHVAQTCQQKGGWVHAG